MRNKFLSRREEIVLTTISLIHEMGVQNVSMKEIGKKEGVSEASLYKHFKNKEELFNCVMDYYEKFDRNMVLTMENNGLEAKENILKYFCVFAEYYNNYKEITSFRGIYDILSYNIKFRDRAKENLGKSTKMIEDLVARAQEQGELQDTLTPESMACILLGTFDRIIGMWRIKDYSFSLNLKTEEIISNILDAYSGKNR